MQRDLNNTLSLRLKQCVLPVVAATLAACATTSTTSNVREAKVLESSSRVEVEEAVVGEAGEDADTPVARLSGGGGVHGDSLGGGRIDRTTPAHTM